MAWEDKSDKKYIRYVNEAGDGTGLTVYRDRNDSRVRLYNASLVYQNGAEPVRIYLNIDSRAARRESDITPELVQQFATQRMSDSLLSGQKEAQRKLDMCSGGLSCMEALSVPGASRQKGVLEQQAAVEDSRHGSMQEPKAAPVKKELAAKPDATVSALYAEGMDVQPKAVPASNAAQFKGADAGVDGGDKPHWIDDSMVGSEFHIIEAKGIGFISAAGDWSGKRDGRYRVELYDEATKQSFTMPCDVHAKGNPEFGVTASDVRDTVMRELGVKLCEDVAAAQGKLELSERFRGMDNSREKAAADKAVAMRKCFAEIYKQSYESYSVQTQQILSDNLPLGLLPGGAGRRVLSMDDARMAKPATPPKAPGSKNAAAFKSVARRIPETPGEGEAQSQADGPEFW